MVLSIIFATLATAALVHSPAVDPHRATWPHYGAERALVSFSTTTHAPVEWSLDQNWFDERRKLDRSRPPFKKPIGCCPVARVLYKTRYAPSFRCCRFNNGGLLKPLRPLGGVDWTNSSLRNVSIHVVGDSLAEQHFTALLCLAWSSGLKLSPVLKLHGKDKDGINPGTSWACTIVPLGVEVAFTRSIRLAVLDAGQGISIAGATFLLVGGWHHIDYSVKVRDLDAYLGEIAAVRGATAATLVVEETPAHFPGGIHLSTHTYPPAEGINEASICDTMAGNTSYADVNKLIRASVAARRHQGFRVLELGALYHGRGDAHVGSMMGKRDCLHWCVAPGVLDAMALQTVAALDGFSRLGTREPAATEAVTLIRSGPFPSDAKAITAALSAAAVTDPAATGDEGLNEGSMARWPATQNTARRREKRRPREKPTPGGSQTLEKEPGFQWHKTLELSRHSGPS